MLTGDAGSPFTATARPFSMATSSPHPTPHRRQGVFFQTVPGSFVEDRSAVAPSTAAGEIAPPAAAAEIAAIPFRNTLRSTGVIRSLDRTGGEHRSTAFGIRFLVRR
jgi:hypothetical protein